MNIPRILVISLLILSQAFLPVQAQMGGGDDSARDSSGADSGSDDQLVTQMILWAIRSKQKCKAVGSRLKCCYKTLGTWKTCYYKHIDPKKQNAWSILALIFLGMFFVFVEMYYFLRKPIIVWSIFLKTIYQSIRLKSTLGKQERLKIIKQLKRKRVMQIKVKQQIINCRIKELKCYRWAQCQYYVHIKADDQYGMSQLQGWIVFVGDGVVIRLSKTYDNAQTSGQIRQFNTLLYMGQNRKECVHDSDQVNVSFQGKWAYYGFQTDQQYSGTWFMK